MSLCKNCKFWTRYIQTEKKIESEMDPQDEPEYRKLDFLGQVKFLAKLSVVEILDTPIVYPYGFCRLIANIDDGILQDLDSYLNHDIEDDRPEYEKLDKVVRTNENFGCIHFQDIE